MGDTSDQQLIEGCPICGREGSSYTEGIVTRLGDMENVRICAYQRSRSISRHSPTCANIQRSRLDSFPLQSHHPDRVSSYSLPLAWHGPDFLPSQEERERHHLPRQDVGEKPDILLRPARS